MRQATWTDADVDIYEAMDGDSGPAMEIVYDRYGGLAYGLALRILQDSGRAEDVVQEVFLGLWRRHASFDPQKGTFRTWLMTLVRNRSIDNLRGRNRHARGEVELPPEVRDLSVSTNPWPAVSLSLERDVVHEALLSLPQEQRQAIELAHFGGFTHVEIAEQLRLPLGTVKGRLRLGLEKMHGYLTMRGVVEA